MEKTKRFKTFRYKCSWWTKKIEWITLFEPLYIDKHMWNAFVITIITMDIYIVYGERNVELHQKLHNCVSRNLTATQPLLLSSCLKSDLTLKWHQLLKLWRISYKRVHPRKGLDWNKALDKVAGVHQLHKPPILLTHITNLGDSRCDCKRSWSSSCGKQIFSSFILSLTLLSADDEKWCLKA